MNKLERRQPQEVDPEWVVCRQQGSLHLNGRKMIQTTLVTIVSVRTWKIIPRVEHLNVT